ncbi:hypothetical protein CALVIDRAFT_122784 [Calocera viscosa TUFC12733]|uniref:RING-type domain-containing protein n=1 Tax=Calocera viscosa (strain TUFC12733) TaxID=1330018 RepID=A0A167RMP6_CALVF|nr:hypothetical protein CALVIDRAFT_122784 [Calocera viscosa TUFC12733]
MSNDTTLLSLLPQLQLPGLELLKHLSRSALSNLGLSLYANLTYANTTLADARAGALAAAAGGGLGGAGGAGGGQESVLGGTGAGFWTSKWALSNVLMRTYALLPHVPSSPPSYPRYMRPPLYNPTNPLQPILLYRIQHLHIPRSRLRRALRRFPPPLWTVLLPLPINPRRLRTRLLLRAPSLYLLLRSFLVLCVMLAQAGGFYPAHSTLGSASSWAEGIGHWAQRMRFESACWSAYTAVCVAMLMGTFLGNLEGGQGGEVAFNLFPFAMLLYTHSTLVPSPTSARARAPSSDTLPPRPSAHAVLTILMPFTLMLALHVMGVSRKWAGRKLVPSAIAGILGQVHFLYVIAHQIRAYPAFSFVGGLIELAFLLSILLSAILRALTQVLLDGTLSLSILGHPAGLPTLEDDWGVALLKLGQAGLYDLSRRAGLANELVELNEQAREPEVLLSKSGAELLLPPAPRPSSAARAGAGGAGRAGDAAGAFGFNREVRTIKVRPDDARGSVYNLSELGRAGWRLLRTAGVAARGVHRRWILKPHEPEREGEGEDGGREVRDVGELGAGGEMGAEGEGDEERVYRRFLEGVVDEEEDEEWCDEDSDEEEEGEESEEQPGEQGEDERAAEEDAREDSGLYSDLLQPPSANGADSGSLAPVLVAHLTSPHALTRRRYQALVLHPPAATHDSDNTEWRAFLAQRRAEGAHVDWARSSETALMCAVCMSEPRAVVCWPCRCLAMCDECRAGIAARFVLRGQHTCPCCRQTVDGYSRIYIP